MNTFIRLILCLSTGAYLAGALSPLIRAVEPPPGRATGHVLVLDNERTLEGDIERQGDQFCIRRAIGATWIRREQVLRLCADRQEAFEYISTRANLRDPDERLRLAKWCHLYGLRRQALEEATAAVALRPSHAESQRLLSALQHTAARQQDEPSATVVAAAEPEPTPTAPPFDLGAEAVGLFSTRVQSILMNTCASCHANGKAGAFRLTRASEGTASNRRATQQNMAAVLAQLNLDRPPASPLLLKAVTAHGEAQLPPIKNRQAPAYKILEAWTRLAILSAPPRDVAATATALMAAPDKSSQKTEAKAEASVFAATKETPSAAESTPATPTPAAGPKPADPFDPGEFNRQSP